MKSNLIFYILISSLISIFFVLSCSGSNSPVDPATGRADGVDTFGVALDQSRNFLSAYNVEIDPDSMTMTCEPLLRTPTGHLPLSYYFPQVLALTGYGFDPAHNNDFYGDIRLNHPYPGSGIDGFDPRVIAIVPANDGVSMNYPTFNVHANNSAIVEPDGYTPLWDELGGSMPGNANPFISYFKSEPNRVWSSTGATQETQRIYVDLNGFGGALAFILVVDVSTNFPAPPQPVVDNAPEPVAIIAQISDGLTTLGGEATVEVTFLDWQGPDEIKCKIEAPDIFDLGVQLFYDRPGHNDDAYIFTGTISNYFSASAGDYDVLIAAWDIPTDIHIYAETVATVGYEPSAWYLDPTRANVDLTTLGSLIPPKPGSDLGVIDCDDEEVNGVVMYEPEDMVVRMNLELTTSELYGYSYMPQDNDPENPHPNPEILPAGRIDGNNNGVVVQSWIDGHLGAGPDLRGNYQREDSLIGIMRPDGYGWLDFEIAAMPSMADIPSTPENEEEEKEKPKLTDVYEEFDLGDGKFTVSGIWTGTTQLGDIGGIPCYRVGVMGGIKEPYYNPPFIVMDWGLWIFNGPPTNEIVAADASQDPLFGYQYWGFSGDVVGPALVGAYFKDGTSYNVWQPSNLEAKLLDLELIPVQDPPLHIKGCTQDIDWIAVLLDNQTIEIMDPFGTSGTIVDIIDVSMLEGDAVYLDIANRSAEIYISHTDGITPYCSVFILE